MKIEALTTFLLLKKHKNWVQKKLYEQSIFDSNKWRCSSASRS